MNFETIATPRHIYLDRSKHRKDTAIRRRWAIRWTLGQRHPRRRHRRHGRFKGLTAIPGGGFRTIRTSLSDTVC
jgi:hypothetical protein